LSTTLVEHDFRTALEVFAFEFGVQRYTHLASARVHVDGAVLVRVEERAVRGRWPRQLVHLVAQRGDVLARFTERVGQLLVL
jgi:hypothetical protein